MTAYRFGFDAVVAKHTKPRRYQEVFLDTKCRLCGFAKEAKVGGLALLAEGLRRLDVLDSLRNCFWRARIS